ncbi:hypothetical protein [uncultured Tateyamaria sp.]|uniref:hypothetical protein n=1 Tax=Tateyamaria sp. 1078 TaxID=3417464 RepID=UPI002630E181|nr:hypothetical protein [uncultured Tateyamaria sp.]
MPKRIVNFSNAVIVGITTSVISAVLILFLVERDTPGVFDGRPKIGQNVNKPNLGIQLYQDNKRVASLFDEKWVSHFELRAKPFSLRVPASHWASPDENYPAVSVIVSGQKALVVDPWDKSVAAGLFYMGGTGMAGHQFGVGSLFNAGLDCPDEGVVTDGKQWLPQNYLVGDRTNRSNPAYREIYISSILDHCTRSEMIRRGANIFMVVRLVDTNSTVDFGRHDVELIKVSM